MSQAFEVALEALLCGGRGEQSHPTRRETPREYAVNSVGLGNLSHSGGLHRQRHEDHSDPGGVKKSVSHMVQKSKRMGGGDHPYSEITSLYRARMPGLAEDSAQVILGSLHVNAVGWQEVMDAVGIHRLCPKSLAGQFPRIANRYRPRISGKS